MKSLEITKCEFCDSEITMAQEFCTRCGKSVNKSSKVKNNEKPEVQVFNKVTELSSDLESDEPSAFAMGLPNWSIEPPQVVVRRGKKL